VGGGATTVAIKNSVSGYNLAMEIVVQLLLNALVAGAIYALVALGFNLIYSTARFFDFGYGALAAVGGYATFLFYKLLGLDIFLSLILGVLIAGTIGFLIERVVYRPLRARKSSKTVLLVASIGVLAVVQAIIAILFSSQFQTLALSNQQVIGLLGGSITQTQVITLLAGLIIMIALAITFKYTLFGKAVRAVSDDEEVAQIVGINSEKTIGYVFFIASAIGGLAGIAAGFDTGLQPMMGFSLLLKGVVASIVGGVGNMYGAVLGAVLLALIETIGVWQFSGEWKDAVAFAVLIIFLLFRPQGILSR